MSVDTSSSGLRERRLDEVLGAYLAAAAVGHGPDRQLEVRALGELAGHRCALRRHGVALQLAAEGPRRAHAGRRQDAIGGLGREHEDRHLERTSAAELPIR